MKFTLATLAALAVSSASAFIVNTPSNVVQCQPILLTWDPTGSTGPYFLSVHPGADPTGPALLSFNGLTGTSYSWPAVNITGGTSIDLTLRDSSGLTVQSAPFTVQTSANNACLTGVTSGSSTSSVSGSSTSVSSSTSSSSSTTGTSTSHASSSSGVSSISSHSSGSTGSTGTPSASAHPAATTTSGATPDKIARVGLVSVVGAVLAAVWV